MKCTECKKDFFEDTCSCGWEPDPEEGKSYIYYLKNMHVGTCYQENGKTTIWCQDTVSLPGSEPAAVVDSDDSYSLEEAEMLFKKHFPPHVGKYLTRISPCGQEVELR